MRLVSIACGIALALSAGLVSAQTATQAAPAPAASAQPTRYSTARSQLGTLIADPAAKAVLVKHVPKLLDNPDMAERASGMTLKEIQEATRAYAADLLSDAVLGAIDRDLAQIK